MTDKNATVQADPKLTPRFFLPGSNVPTRVARIPEEEV